MPRAYVSIGSNVDRERNVRGAVTALREQFDEVRLSPVYETKAEGFDGDDFYNLVAAFDTALCVEELNDILNRIEAAHGRNRTAAKYGPRTLDIDLLLYGDLVRHDAQANVPRPELLRFAFMLGPLVDIAPTLSHPETGERLIDQWRAHRDYGKLRAISFDLD